MGFKIRKKIGFVASKNGFKSIQIDLCKLLQTSELKKTSIRVTENNSHSSRVIYRKLLPLSESLSNCSNQRVPVVILAKQIF